MVPQDRRITKYGHYLDGSDPDVIVLRRADGSFVAAFSAMGAVAESIVLAAEADYREATEGSPHPSRSA